MRSTDLVSAIGDEAWLDVVRWHDEKLRSLFAEHGGEEVDHAGDGFFVAFEHPASAIGCAVANAGRSFAVSTVAGSDSKGISDPVEVVAIDWRAGGTP